MLQDNKKYTYDREQLLKLIKIIKEKNSIENPIFKKFENLIFQMLNSEKTFQLVNHIFDLFITEGIRNLNDYILYFEASRNKKELIRLGNYSQNHGVNIFNPDNDIIKLVIEVIVWITENLNIINSKLELPSDTDTIEWDVFLSHRFVDKFYNLILFYILSVYYDLKVYVDWIYDSDANRKKIDKDTMILLKKRLKKSKDLLFFNVNRFKTTPWMYWEVGFHGGTGGKIGLLDLAEYCRRNTNIEVLASNDVLVIEDSEIVKKGSNMNIGIWGKTKKKTLDKRD